MLQTCKTVGESNDRSQPGMFAAERPELFRLLPDRGICERPGDLLRLEQCLAESGLHALLRRRRGSRLCLISPAEPVDPAGGVYKTLLAREVGMALSADLDVNRCRGRARLELIAAGALHHELAVWRMNIGLHFVLHWLSLSPSI
jgi:hypothetical protein